MIWVAVASFALAAVLGATLLTYVLRGLPTPKGLALIHGAFAAGGIAFLLLHWVRTGQLPAPSLALFVLAALGGFFLLYRDLAHGRVPKPLALGHGLLAVTAFVLLLAWLFR